MTVDTVSSPRSFANVSSACSDADPVSSRLPPALTRILSPRRAQYRVLSDRPQTPREGHSTTACGLYFTFGPAVLTAAYALLFSGSRLQWWAPPAALAINAAFFVVALLERERARPNCRDLAPQSVSSLLASTMMHIGVSALVVGVAVIVVGHVYILQSLGALPATGMEDQPGNVGIRGMLMSTLWALPATFVADFAYYWSHRCLGHGKPTTPLRRLYFRNHLAHHVVPELDFTRGNMSNLFDAGIALQQPSVLFAAVVMQLTLPQTMMAYILLLAMQTKDHANFAVDLPPWMTRVFMSKHAHSLHHCKYGGLINHAAVFSVFDRLWGTYYEDYSLNGNFLHHHHLPLPIRPLGK